MLTKETYVGEWEDIEGTHAKQLSGKIVRVEALDEDTKQNVRRFREMVAKMEAITVGVAPLNRLLTSADIYESAE
ncbi:MAG: hypothetical protein ACAH95_07120 [Fimbriimonas sp.]